MFKEDFEIQERLGEGSFAKVYKCLERNSGKTFAVKELVHDQHFAEMENVTEEVDIWKELKHENIVSLHRTFTDNSSLFLVCEYMDGGSLFDEIVGQKVYSEEQARFIMKQLLQALKYLHGKRIVHRDVKADNLLLSRSKDSDHVTVKLADFGLARRLPVNSDVISCEASGAPLFLAPETILEDLIGQAVDLWACGVILFILLAGYPPFWNSSDEKLLLSILQGHYTMPSPYWDNVSNEAKDLVQRLLVVEPRQRLTASEALNHPWLLMKAPQSPQKHAHRRNFAAVICGVRAMLKFRRMNLKDSALRRQLSEVDVLN